MLSENNTQFSHRYTPLTRRYTGPTARDLADRLPGSRQEGSGFRLRGWCHGHGNVGDSASLAVWDSPKPEGGLNVKCWASCDRRTIIGALEQNTGFRIWDAWEGSGPPWSPGDRLPPPQAAPGGPKPPISTPSGRGRQPPRNGGDRRPERTVDLQAIARRTWSQDSQPIPADPDHPARRWLAARNLWRPELPPPGALRWLPAAARYQGRGPHTGAGSIIALAAPPAAWTVAWPELPIPQSVQIIAVDAEGNPALDRPADSGGLGKRSIGSTTGAIVVLGCAELADALEPVRVAEGVADALALASHYPGTSIATLGTSTMQENTLPAWLATAAAGVVVHADADAGGERAARELRRSIQAAGGIVQAYLPARGKDAADAAAAAAFGPLPDGWPDYARTLRDTTKWPRWEIARQAVNILSERADE